MELGDGKSDVLGIFQRQRRNLFLSSVLLFFIQTTGATMQGVSVGGVSIHFESPGVVMLWLWAAMAYFLLRYYQHLSGVLRNFWGAYEVERYGLHLEAVKRIAIRKISRHEPKIDKSSIDPSFETLGSNVRKMRWKLRTVGYRIGGAVFNGPIRGMESYEVSLSSFRRIWLEFLCWIKTSLKTDAFTEYLLPLVLPLFPIGNALVGCFLG
jgi:hypothetical protein